MNGELAPTQSHSDEVAIRNTELEAYEQPEVIDGELVESNELAIRETGVVPYEGQSIDGELVGEGNQLSPWAPRPEDYVDADVVEDEPAEPLAITPPPTTEPTKLTVAMVGQDVDLDLNAKDEATERLTDELNEGGKVSRIMKGIWKGYLAKGAYINRYEREAKARKLQNNDILDNVDPAASAQSKQSTIERFISEFDETIHTGAGEHREVLASDHELSQNIKQLIRRSIDENLSEDALIEERTRILIAYKDTYGDELLGPGIMTADNLLAVRAAVLGAMEHGESIDSLMENMSIVVGESRSGVRGEVHYNAVERTIDKLNGTKIGGLVGPEVVAFTAQLAASLMRIGSRKALAAAAMTIAPGAGAAVWAGVRENKLTKDDRLQSSREMAQGAEFRPGDKRRVEMELARYETVTAAELTDLLEARFGDEVDLSDPIQLQAALDVLGATELRIQISDTRNMNLISYSSIAAVEEERLALDLALGFAKSTADLHLDATARQALGLDADASLKTILDQRSEAFLDAIESDIEAKDEAFKRIKAKRVAKATAVGLLTGLSFGLLSQEMIATFSDTRQGLIEQLWHAPNKPFDGSEHQTVLHGLFDGDKGQDTITHHGPDSVFHTSTIGDHQGVYNVSGDQHLIDNGDHTINLVDPTGHATIEHLAVNPDGSLPAASLAILHEHGMNVMDKSSTVDVLTHETRNVSVDKYAQSHGVKVTRDLWYDENTPAPVFDKNELGLHWGGNNGLAAGGGFALSVSTMSENGSFTGNQSADWLQQAQAGHLKLAISGSINSQNMPILVDIKANGLPDLSAGSPAAHFFANENGHAVFTGAYAEVVQTTGVDSHGVEHIRPLATLVGNNSVHTVPQIIDIHTPRLHPEYTIISGGYDTTEHIGSFTEMAPVIPIVSRRPLESLAKRRNEASGGGYGDYSGEILPAERDRMDADRSPRMQLDADVDLAPREELDWYVGELQTREGGDYVRQLEASIDDTPELKNLPPKLKSIVTIPVAAATESDNIYGTLSLYSQQEGGALEGTTILLNVNWLDAVNQDPGKRINIQKTLAEIERAKHDFPDLNIAVVTHEYNQAVVERTGGVLGYVARDLTNMALVSIQRGMQSGVIASDEDIVIIRNDADMKGMSRRHLAQFQKTMDENRSIDILKGTTRFGVSSYQNYPGFGIASNFSAALTTIAVSEGSIHTGGANFGIRASTLAAIGGLGDILKNPNGTGAGSDDVAIGRRLANARRVYDYQAPTSPSVAGYGSASPVVGGTYPEKPAKASGVRRKRIKQVAGATIDTDADRFIPRYLLNRPYQEVWGDSDGFQDGPGAYKNRDAEKEVMKKYPKENYKDARVYDLIETSITRDLSWSGGSSSRALAVFFGAVPGAYTIKGSGENSTFKLTKAGRQFVKDRVERESNGRFGSYGMRKMRQLYGQTSGKRQPVPSMSPLVSTL